MTSAPIRLVRQPNKSSGCGHACVAMVAGVRLNTAIIKMCGSLKKRGLYTQYDELKEGLRLFKASPGRFVRSVSFGSATSLSVFGCQWEVRGEEEIWHWVLYDPARKRLYDPLKPKPLVGDGSDFDDEYQPFSRLAVRRPSA